MTKDELTKDEISLPDEREEAAFWGAETADASMGWHDGPSGRVDDLGEQTTLFGESVIRLARRIPRSLVHDRRISQLVGAATSVGANYGEAEDGVSRKDFRNRIGTCKKEARETKYFLRLIATADESLKTGSADSLAGSPRTSPHLLRHLAPNHSRLTMPFVIPSFALRHFSL